MRNKTKIWGKALVIFGIAVAAWSVPFTIDSVRTGKNQLPACCFKIEQGGSLTPSIYIGLFYTVYVFDYFEGCVSLESGCGNPGYREIEIHSWFRLLTP